MVATQEERSRASLVTWTGEEGRRLANEGGSDFVWTAVVVIAAAGAIGAFAFFTIKPDTMAMVERATSQSSANDASLFSESLLKQIADMPPSVALATGRQEDAISGAADLVKSKKYDVKSYMCAGNVYVMSNDTALQPKGYSLLRETVYLCPESRYVHLNFARQLVALNRLEEAGREYDKLCGSFGNWLPPRLEQAALFMKLGQPADAARRVKEVLDSDPNNPQALKIRGIIKGDEGSGSKDDAKTKQGFADYTKAFDNEKKLKCPPDSQAIVDINDGSVQKAIAFEQQRVQNNKDDVDAKLLLAQLLIYQGQLTDAKALLLDAQKNDPKNPEPHRLLAEVLYLMKDEQGAFAEFKEAARQDQPG